MFCVGFLACCAGESQPISPSPLPPQPLICDAPDMAGGRVKHTYGRKKTTSTQASAIFGNSDPELLGTREPLADITDKLNKFEIGSASNHDEKVTKSPASVASEASSGSQYSQESGFHELLGIPKLENKKGRMIEGHDLQEANAAKENNHSSSGSTVKASNSLVDPLQDLLNDYNSNSASTWADLLEDRELTIVKIAEASFAEVYRLSNSTGVTSIMKVMRFSGVYDPGLANFEATLAFEDMMSEIRIMEALGDLHGMLVFRSALIVRGKASPALTQASYDYLGTVKGSYHPDPKDYSDNSTFMVIELGDAGGTLEDLKINDIDQVWDVLLGVVVALARAEMEFEFEHRDLHENNICFKLGSPATDVAKFSKEQKFGRSGLAITLIDYGLSRAKLPNGTVFNDLEKDIELFHAPQKIQNETYRRMRTFLLERKRIHRSKQSQLPQLMANNEAGYKSWEEHMPYTNVLWIRYLMWWLQTTFRKYGDSKALELFQEDAKELQRGLSPVTKLDDSFATAAQILDYTINKGWITREQALDGHF